MRYLFNKIFSFQVKAIVFVIFITVAGGILGSHLHEPPKQALFDIQTAKPDRTIVANLFSIGYDLTQLELVPGKVIDLVLANSAGTTHTFSLSNPFNDLYQYNNSFGEIVLRIIATEEGVDNFVCTIPGHEGLHANFIIAN
jgi:uncharacterized cupredoxin-like copper-binding protein